MNYLWGAVSAISAPYQYYRDLPPLNPATLTGAIDVIVVRRPVSPSPSSPSSSSPSPSSFSSLSSSSSSHTQTYELACSPFHVRFGKWQVLRPADKSVRVAVNGRVVPFPMKIGDAGEAFFVFETAEDADVPDGLLTSPVIRPTSPGPSGEGDGRDGVGEGGRGEEEPGRFGARSAAATEPDFLDLDALAPPPPPEESASSGGDDVEKTAEADGPPRPLDESAPDAPDPAAIVLDGAGYHPGSLISDSAIPDIPHLPEPSHIPNPSVPASASSATITASSPSPSASSSSRPPPPPPPVPFPSLDDPEADAYTWEWGAFPQRSPAKATFPRSVKKPPPQPSSLSQQHSQPFLPTTTTADEDEDEEEEGRVPADFYRSKSLPPDFEAEQLQLQSDAEPEPPVSEPEPLSDAEHEPLSDTEPLSDPEREAGTERPRPTDPPSSWSRWWRRSGRTQSVILDGATVRTPGAGSAPTLKEMKSSPDVAEAARAGAQTRIRARSASPVPPPSPPSESLTPEPSVPEPYVPGLSASAPRPRAQTTTTPPTPEPTTTKRYAKTLRLSSDQLASLDLKPGPNSLTFSLSATGAVVCTAKIFLWDHTDHIVVSDIDGTITKSDALGHVFTMIGRDWTHVGVAKLYTDIVRNGYKIVYLTSRAIGQADTTRWYLQSIKQDAYQLPEGPVIMSPDRLLASLHREVIMRKPEVFKMACLRDIQRLFGPAQPHPFYAGFGNRITDALSYRSVNIPSSRIFTIDSNGEVRMELLELAGYKSPSVQSYILMTDLVDQMFPPVNQKQAPEYTDNTFWRAPLPDVVLPDLAPPVPVSPALSARSDASAFARLRNFSLRSRTSSPRSTVAALEGGRAEARAGVGAGAGASASGDRRGGGGGGGDDRRGRADSREPRHRQTSVGISGRVADAFVSLSRSLSPPASLSLSASPTRFEGSDADGEADYDDDDGVYGAAESGAVRRRRARTRRRTRSLESMPGSLPGTDDELEEEDDVTFGGDSGEGKIVEDAEEAEAEGVGEDGEYGDGAEEQEPTFDDDLFATGEMQKVPFL